MAELEKVIRGLECCILRDPDDHARCSQCSYGGNCVNRLKMDALSLLKAQEPILLENQHKPYGHIINANSPWISRCPKCGKKIEGKQTRFCKYCGQAVKWDGFDRKTFV